MRRPGGRGSDGALAVAPPRDDANVNRDPPFCKTKCEPTLNDAEIADIVAFLHTLDDGYR